MALGQKQAGGKSEGGQRHEKTARRHFEKRPPSIGTIEAPEKVHRLDAKALETIAGGDRPDTPPRCSTG